MPCSLKCCMISLNEVRNDISWVRDDKVQHPCRQARALRSNSNSAASVLHWGTKTAHSGHERHALLCTLGTDGMAQMRDAKGNPCVHCAVQVQAGLMRRLAALDIKLVDCLKRRPSTVSAPQG